MTYCFYYLFEFSIKVPAIYAIISNINNYQKRHLIATSWVIGEKHLNIMNFQICNHLDCILTGPGLVCESWAS